MFNTAEEINQFLAQQAAWQNQLQNGVNIANTGWQTALGLALGTGLGNWLGHQFGNWQRNRDEKLVNSDATNRLTQQAARNLFGSEFDLGWKPSQDPYRFPTANELFTNAVTYDPNKWRQFSLIQQTPAVMPNVLQPQTQFWAQPNQQYTFSPQMNFSRTPPTLQKFF